MGNGKEHKRNLRGQLCKQNNNGGGAEVERIKHHHCYLMGRHKDTGWTSENRERREQGIHREEEGQRRNKEKKPLSIVWMKSYLCLGTELIVCSHLLSCFFPEPPSADRACSKAGGDWCGSCTMGKSVSGTRSTSVFSFVHSARFAPQGFNWLKCKSTTSYPTWQPVLENVHV